MYSTLFTITAGLAIAVGSAIVTLAIVSICGWFRSVKREIAQLKDANKNRLPYRAADGLEDAIAVLMDAQNTAEYEMLRINRALEIARAIRGNPDGYDSERENNKKAR